MLSILAKQEDGPN